MRFDIPFPKDRAFDVVGMGLNSVDLLCIVPRFPAFNSKMKLNRFSKQGGGQVATAMVALARWGLKTKYLGKIGGDEFGRFSLKSIRDEGVDVSGVVLEPDSATQMAVILVDGSSGERTILWDRDNRLMYREGELRKTDICCGKILHMDGHDTHAALQCARWAHEEGIRTVIDTDRVDPLSSELLKEIDFVITSAQFPMIFTGIPHREKALLELQKHTRGFVCATLGREGAMCLVDGNIVYAPGFQVNAVDTTGAGDVFHAGFIYGLLQNWELNEILSFANAAAALKCLDLGGRTGIPGLEEARRFAASARPGPG
jgi:sulfofructose kinase